MLGKSIAEHTAEQERQLRARQKQIRDQEAQAAYAAMACCLLVWVTACPGSLLQRQLEEKEERRMAVEESFSSLAQEVEVKTRKLQKLWDKLKVGLGLLGPC